MTIEKNGEAPKKLSEVLLVGVDCNGEDKFTLVVGKKDVEEKTTEIFNVITGDKAREMYIQLKYGSNIPEVK